MSSEITFGEVLLSVVLAFFLYQYLNFHRLRLKVKDIPTVGSKWSDTFLGAYIATWAYVFHVEDWVKEGYTKYHGAAFKMPTFLTSSGYIIVATGETMTEDMRKAPSDVLSMHEAVLDSLESERLFGKRHAVDGQFHTHVIRTPLTRAIGDVFPDIQEEIVEACKEHLPVGDDWEVLPQVHKAMIRIVARTSNRLFVGLPLCRHPEYLKIQEDWTVHVIMAGYMLHVTPWFMKPVVSLFLSQVKSSTKKVEKYVGKIIEERLEKEKELGKDWPGKPNDMISWLVDYAPPQFKTVDIITVRLMLTNFAAIHTSSIATTWVLLNLAARREYINPIRAEVEEAIQADGWTKEGVARMVKLDSFVKESLRLSGFSPVNAQRKAMKDFTFSNGLKIPAGFTVATASSAIHMDPNIYEDPQSFNGYRFVDKGAEDPLRAQTVALDPTWQLFGQGRNACPGRFFAINEVKTIISHILLNYDIKLPGDATEPTPGMWFAGSQSPDPNAEVLFRKRKAD